MPSGFPTLIVALVIIYMFTGTTPLVSTKLFTSGKFVYTQDEQTSDQRRVRSICLRSCAKQAKVIFRECIQSCQRELITDQTLDFTKTVIEKPLILSRRSVDNMNARVVNECVTSPHYPKAHKAEGLSVDFTTKKPQVEVSWKAIDQTDFNWTAYAVIYQIHTETKASCKVVSKNQTHFLVPAEHWTHPNSFYVAVVTHPYNAESKVEFESFDPTVTRTVFTPTVNTTDKAKLVTSIVVGLMAGVLLLLFLYFAIKWRKKRQCAGSDPTLYPNPPPAPMRSDNSKEKYYTCYYPEGEEFRERIASIVNYFRQNGYNVIMDVMVSGEITSQGPTRWAESQVRKARKVLVFLSPGLINLALDGRDNSQSQDINRVWIELEVLRDIYTRHRSAAKMVCIALPDTPVSSSELPLWAKVSYKWPADAQEILKRLNDRPMILPL